MNGTNLATPTCRNCGSIEAGLKAFEPCPVCRYVYEPRIDTVNAAGIARFDALADSNLVTLLFAFFNLSIDGAGLAVAPSMFWVIDGLVWLAFCGFCMVGIAEKFGRNR
jgi:hypothetical protein